MTRVLFCVAVIFLLFCNGYATTNSDDEILTKAIKKFYIPAPKGKEVIDPKKLPAPAPVYTDKTLEKYKPLKVLSLFPKKFNGNKINLIPISIASFLPVNEYYIKWGKTPKKQFIFLGPGVYSLDMIWRKFKGRNIITKTGNAFTLHYPLFISKEGVLVIRNQELRLDIEGAPVFVNGKMYVGNSKILAWNAKQNKYAKQHKYSAEDFYLYGKVDPRPYIIAIKTGSLIFVNNLIKGLGYRGLFGSFGVSLSSWPTKQFKLGLININTLLGEGYSTGIFVGNEFVDNYMGFYSNEARNVIFIGNYIHDNLQYGVDPHDWTKNMITAYNYIKKTKKAHGIVFSRFTSGAIFGNILEGNHGAGIMIDRNSYAHIHNNVLFANMLGGISIIESDGNHIENNTLIRNFSYGIYVRNSLNTLIKGNKLIRNVGAGIDVANIDIRYQVYRNLYLDKYHNASSAWIENNLFYNNFSCDVKSTNNGALALYKNFFLSGINNILCKSIKNYLSKTINFQKDKPVIIRGYGDKNLIGNESLNPLPVIENILYDLSKENINSRTALGIIELGLSGKESKTGLNWLISSASQGDMYGFLYLGIHLFTNKNPKKREEGLLLLSQAAILGCKIAQHILYLLPSMTELSEKDINSAILKAGKRLKSGIFLNCKIFYNKRYCCDKNFDTIEEIRHRIIKFFKLYALSGAKTYGDFFYSNIINLKNNNLQKRIIQLKKTFEYKNKDKLKYFNWLKEQKRKIKKELEAKNYQVAKFYNKKKVVEKSWDNLLKISEKEDFKILESDIRTLLVKFNSFRVKKLNIDKIIDNIRREYFEK